MTGRVLSFIAVLALTLIGVGAAAQESVRTRAASHPDYGRIVFDWPYRVGFSADIEGDVLAVRFDSPLSTDLNRALRRVRGYVKSGAVSADGQIVRLELDGPHTAVRSGTGPPSSSTCAAPGDRASPRSESASASIRPSRDSSSTGTSRST